MRRLWLSGRSTSFGLMMLAIMISHSVARNAQKLFPGLPLPAKPWVKYREAGNRHQRPLLFVQPFGLRSIGGGPRIMRALLQDAPSPTLNVSTYPAPPPGNDIAREVHLPLRPSFGRIEKTRWAGIPQRLTPLFAGQFERQLEALARRENVPAIHAVAHGGPDFLHSCQVARRLGLPFFLHVHDDLLYTAREIRSAAAAHAALRECWESANARFVICDALGEEYATRYGARDYTVVSDGLEEIADNVAVAPGPDLRIYFMGMFHLEYEDNFSALFTAASRLQQSYNTGKISITLRCGGVRRHVLEKATIPVTVLPFGSKKMSRPIC